MRVVRKFALFAIIVAATLAGAAPPATRYEIRPGYTNITFSITKWMVMQEEGTFRDFSGTLVYDADRPQASQVEFTVQAASIDTRIDMRDKVLRSDDFFHVERFPVLTFKSTEVRSVGADALEVTGDFTVHGTTKRIKVPVKVLGQRDVPDVGRVAGFDARFTINRRDYGVLGTRWGAVPGTLGDEVEIHIQVGAVRR